MDTKIRKGRYARRREQLPSLLTVLNWGWGLSCRQNTELAKLRQELSKVNKELVEKSEASRQEEQQRKALEAKAATFEKQVLQLQVSSSGSHSSACSLPARPDCRAGTVPGHRVVPSQSQQTAGDGVGVWGLNLA